MVSLRLVGLKTSQLTRPSLQGYQTRWNESCLHLASEEAHFVDARGEVIAIENDACRQAVCIFP